MSSNLILKENGKRTMKSKLKEFRLRKKLREILRGTKGKATLKFIKRGF